MSQAGIISTSSGPVPPSVATSYVTDINSPAIPAANVLDVFGGSVSTNNVNGVQTDGSSGSNILTIELTNRIQATVTTTNSNLTTIATFPLGATPGVFTMEGKYSGFIPALNRGGSYFCDASARTDGATATEIGSDIDTIFEDTEMVTSDVFFTVSGNNVVIQVQGIAATTIHWRVLFDYTLVT